jgi:hypothetical protein
MISSRRFNLWNEDRFQAIEEIADAFTRSEYAPLFSSYIRFLRSKADGVRKHAMKESSAFAEELSGAPFSTRVAICRLIISETEHLWNDWPEADNWIIPGNLGARLFIPTWMEWRARRRKEPDAWVYDFQPYRTMEDGRQTAFMLSPGETKYQYAYLSAVLSKIDFALHELVGLGFVLAESDYLKELVMSVKSVADAMTTNLSPAGESTVTSLMKFALQYEIYAGEPEGFRDHLIETEQKSLLEFPIPGAKGWFRRVPDFMSR